MYSLTNLSKKIADIQRDNFSGVLMVSGQAAASLAKVSTYSLRFESGDLARIGGGTDAKGMHAFTELLQLQNFAEPRWFPLSATPDWSARPEIMRQDMAGLLSLASTPARIETSATSLDADKAGKALMQRVRTVFTNVYIGNTDADLAQVAKLHPPSTEPSAFIDACVHLLEPMLGAEAAQAMLSNS